VNPSPTRPRRDVRDWIVDAALFLLAAGFWVLGTGARLQPTIPEPSWLFALTEIGGALGCRALWLRRRWPVPVTLALVALTVVTELAAVAMVVALFTVAAYRPPRTTAAVFAVSMVGNLVHVLIRPESGASRLWSFLLGVIVEGGVIGWGLSLRHRRQLALSIRERAARAETEARLLAEQAQLRAREEIAREMHDVLGHRLSLLSVHAGALEFHPNAPAEDVARAAKVIRDSAHAALQDLREVIGVIRAPVGELPLSNLADVPPLVAESVRAGTRVELSLEIRGEPPDVMGRTAYRIVQEGLTNARKHASGADVRVGLTGSAGDGLSVEVVNTAAGDGRRPAAGPASGHGLVGLGERVALSGGRLECGPTTDGGWRLAAWLPWPA
jgi:signal transduction histidine kinase